MSNCIFCRIIEGEIPSTLVYENEHVIAFEDINPEAPTHLLIVPKKHIPTTMDVMEEDGKIIMPEIFAAIGHLARQFDLEQEGFRIVNNCGSNGGQTVNHLHFHLLGGRQLQWPPG
ncbi:histidine triad nucleotide-binding protein [Alkaliphilus sp. MSJ-5]|uniref:Histidine triad nucleotide-binding protein n=1 Tax=Alkaliphilus flagellatus TaxID=2841507 RepID=A0ABS6FZJ2_9FIRM|nr:histidine triad nucleotide-binding protein [Alkaliphilus flagellatus]MBU5675666.1 histidine triad nucleotide-binding protein [Alkaliphilus flagellatus]